MRSIVPGAVNPEAELFEETGVRIEKRPDGSVAIRSSRSLRIVCAALGVSVVAAVFAQAPREPARMCLGLLGALLPFVLAALLERAVFDFDVAQRRVRWIRRNLFRTLRGELRFDDIREVALQTRSETDSDSRHRIVHHVHRVVLVTGAGELPLSNAWTGDQGAQARVADAIRAVLGSRPVPPRPG